MCKDIKAYRSLYANRKLSLGYPDLEHLGSIYKRKDGLEKAESTELGNRRIGQKPFELEFSFRLVDFSGLSKCALDIGCGPTPLFLKGLIENGLNAIGVEPISEMCQFAREFLSNESKIVQGYAEKLPFPDNSQAFVALRGVLEHVTSPLLAMREIFRVLEPGGVAYVLTTNRYMFSNHEYTMRLYQWYPAILKESYIFMHLHYRPELARYTSIPAVHWFSYSDLCKLGRDAGFFRFYSIIDLISEEDMKDGLRAGLLARMIIRFGKYNALLRSLILTFTAIGGAIFMLKPKSS